MTIKLQDTYCKDYEKLMHRMNSILKHTISAKDNFIKYCG